MKWGKKGGQVSHFNIHATLAREAGVVYTKPWMVELVLDLAGTLPQKRLGELVALERTRERQTTISIAVSKAAE